MGEQTVARPAGGILVNAVEEVRPAAGSREAELARQVRLNDTYIYI
jgi:hypothetical protein